MAEDGINWVCIVWALCAGHRLWCAANQHTQRAKAALREGQRPRVRTREVLTQSSCSCRGGRAVHTHDCRASTLCGRCESGRWKRRKEDEDGDSCSGESCSDEMRDGCELLRRAGRGGLERRGFGGMEGNGRDVLLSVTVVATQPTSRCCVLDLVHIWFQHQLHRRKALR